MRIYVAASSLERHTRARPAIRALERAGHTVTHDWTHSVDMLSDNCLSSELRACALDDFYGVHQADCLLLLSPMMPSKGAWVELGIALAGGKRVIVAGTCDCIFTWLPGVEIVATDCEALARLGGRL